MVLATIYTHACTTAVNVVLFSCNPKSETKRSLEKALIYTIHSVFDCHFIIGSKFIENNLGLWQLFQPSAIFYLLTVVSVESYAHQIDVFHYSRLVYNGYGNLI